MKKLFMLLMLCSLSFGVNIDESYKGKIYSKDELAKIYGNTKIKFYADGYTMSSPDGYLEYIVTMVNFIDENLGRMGSQGVVLIDKNLGTIEPYSMHSDITSISDLDANGSPEVLLTTSYAASGYVSTINSAFSINENQEVVGIYNGEELGDNTSSGICGETIECSKTEESYSFSDTDGDGVKEMVVSQTSQKNNQKPKIEKSTKIYKLINGKFELLK